jgi:hypothetical protein
MSALTKLKVLELELKNIKTLPTQLPYCFIQLEELLLIDCGLIYLPSSFTCTDAFPSLRVFTIHYCQNLVKFPEVHEGALPKLQLLNFCGCFSLETLPLLGEVDELERIGGG